MVAEGSIKKEELDVGQRVGTEERIYSVTDGLKSPKTAKVYSHAFSLFLRFLQIPNDNDHLQSLIDLKPSVIEAKIISFIEHEKGEERKIVPAAVHLLAYAVLHFFSMNDVMLNTRKIQKFLPELTYNNKDRPLLHSRDSADAG